MKSKAKIKDPHYDWVMSKINHSSEDPNLGFVETLYQTCSASLLFLWKSHFRLTTHNPQKSTLKKDIASIQFWEENFPAGHLDDILAESSGLKIRVLENLAGMGKILVSFFTDYDEARFSTLNECDSESTLANDLETQLEKAALILDAEERSEPSSDEETDDSSPTTERHQNRLGRLHSFISCLMNLTPVLERYISSLQCKAKVQNVPIDTVFRLSHRARPYAMRIRDRFENAPTSIIERLAQANLERLIRLGIQEDEAEQMDDHTNQDTMTLFKPFSLFHDSGLGTSIPPISQYAATVASHTSFLSVTGEEALGRPRVPSLRQEGGRPFQCNYCHRTIAMRNRIEWKMHVFADLESYICTHEDCRDALQTFPTRQLWADHEFNKHFTMLQWRCFSCNITFNTAELFIEHSAHAHSIIITDRRLTAMISEAQETILTPDFEVSKCTLCLQDGWKTKKAYATHVGRHLEEISLACLPRDEEDSSDDDLQTESSSTPVHVDGQYSRSGKKHEVDADSQVQYEEFSVDKLRDYLEYHANSQLPTPDRPNQKESLPVIQDSMNSPPDSKKIHENYRVTKKPASESEIPIRRENSKKKHYFRCRWPDCGATCGTRGSSIRHIEYVHMPSAKYHCLVCGHDSFRKDRHRGHCQEVHSWPITNGDINEANVAIPCPSFCKLCPRSTESWIAFYDCFISHCITNQRDEDLEAESEIFSAGPVPDSGSKPAPRIEGTSTPPA